MKPEKKDKITIRNVFTAHYDKKEIRRLIDGYNKACNDYEAFLPSEIELAHIIAGTPLNRARAYTEIDLHLAKAIARRIGK
jgi:hypothetical protein